MYSYRGISELRQGWLLMTFYTYNIYMQQIGAQSVDYTTWQLYMESTHQWYGRKKSTKYNTIIRADCNLKLLDWPSVMPTLFWLTTISDIGPQYCMKQGICMTIIGILPLPQSLNDHLSAGQIVI